MQNRSAKRYKKRTKFDGMKYGLLKHIEKFILLVIVAVVVFNLLIGLSLVKGESMQPTLHEGELVFYSRIYRDYQPGDVVSVHVPEGKYYVKRIMAVEGDTIDIRDGVVYLNGEALDEPYVKGETKKRSEAAFEYPYTLTENQVFVMGDNREESSDSRSFGPVSERQVKGKLLMHIGKFYIKKI